VLMAGVLTGSVGGLVRAPNLVAQGSCGSYGGEQVVRLLLAAKADTICQDNVRPHPLLPPFLSPLTDLLWNIGPWMQPVYLTGNGYTMSPQSRQLYIVWNSHGLGRRLARQSGSTPKQLATQFQREQVRVRAAQNR